MDREEIHDKVFDILEHAKRVARQKYGMYLQHGDLMVDESRYMGKMKIDDKECMSVVLRGLDDLLKEDKIEKKIEEYELAQEFYEILKKM